MGTASLRGISTLALLVAWAARQHAGSDPKLVLGDKPPWALN